MSNVPELSHGPDAPAPDPEPSDNVLLHRFVVQHDRAALEMIVHRYAGVVWSVCQRVLGHMEDSEDAFQATFLVLARDAARIRRRAALGSWLYGVAYRVAQRVRRDRRSTMRESWIDDMAMTADDPFVRLSMLYDQEIIERELNRLPEHWHTPLVLRYLVGKSNAEIAQDLSLGVAAVEGRLKRARNYLRVRLARHGITFTAAVLVFHHCRAQAAVGPLPECILHTLQTCGANAMGTPLPRGGADAGRAIHLAQQEITAMTMTKTSTLVALAATAIFVTAGTWGLAEGLAQSAAPIQAGNAIDVRAVAAQDEPLAGTRLGAAADPNLVDSPTRPAEPSAFEPPNGPNATPAGPAAPNDSDTGVRRSNQRRPEYFDTKQRSDSELAIEQALLQPTEFEFFQLTLAEMVQKFQQQYEINIMIDDISLNEAAFDHSARHDFVVRNMRFESALEHLMTKLGLTYVVHGEALLITAEGADEQYLETRIYRLPDSLRGFAPEILPAIQHGVGLLNWDEQGGNCSMVPVGNSLMIRATYRMHREITALLAQIQAAEEGR